MFRRSLVALLVMLPAGAGADAVRCGSKLVGDGDTRAEVRRFCGEPVDVQTRSILRRPTYQVNGRIMHFGTDMIETPVEIWTYNFGPRKLMRRIRFVDGVIEDIETLGYGYHEERRR